jgi:ribonuclease HII
MLLIGVDEAGYGPLLGPLVVAGSSFRAEGAPSPEEFASRLAAALKSAGVVVGDSKRLFGVSRDLAALELPLLAFLAVCAAPVGCFDDVLASVGVDACVRRSAPWYAEGLTPFPRRARADDVADAADRLRRSLAAAGIEFVGLVADVLDERRFNAALTSGNKADALFASASGIFDRLATRRTADESIAAVFDRHGGRRYYAPALQRARPDALVTPLVETPTCSDYRFHVDGAPAFVRFQVEADGTFPQVGLASMLAKYLRETFMEMFNAYFARLLPDVAPTAGYVEDGRRWLEAGRAARLAAGVTDADLVRLR